jgi:hypothetical protein
MNVTYLQYIKVLLNEDLETSGALEEPMTRNKNVNSCSKGKKCNTCLFPCADLFAHGSKPKPLLKLTCQECREHWAPTMVQSPHQAAYPPTSLYFHSYPTIENPQSACTAKINFFIVAGNINEDTSIKSIWRHLSQQQHYGRSWFEYSKLMYSNCHIICQWFLWWNIYIKI